MHKWVTRSEFLNLISEYTNALLQKNEKDAANKYEEIEKILEKQFNENIDGLGIYPGEANFKDFPNDDVVLGYAPLHKVSKDTKIRI